MKPIDSLTRLSILVKTVRFSAEKVMGFIPARWFWGLAFLIALDDGTLNPRIETEGDLPDRAGRR